MATKKGSNKNDRLNGTDGDDVLYGLSGNDRLDGGEGDDDLIGGKGNDSFIGRSDGNDAFDGGKGIDTVSYSKAVGGVFIVVWSETDGYTSKGGLYDAIKNVERLVGSKFDDIINFNDAQGGYAFGGKGNDALNAYGGVVRGDQGNDTLYLSAGNADIVWLQRNKGVDTVHSFDNIRDKIWLDSDEFDLGAMLGYHEFVSPPGSGHAPIGTKAQLIYDNGTTELYYDPDGTGSKPTELIADFASSSTISLSNFEIV